MVLTQSQGCSHLELAGRAYLLQDASLSCLLVRGLISSAHGLLCKLLSDLKSQKLASPQKVVEREQGIGIISFVTWSHHHFSYVVFIRRESLSPVHTELEV